MLGYKIKQHRSILSNTNTYDTKLAGNSGN